MEEVQRATGGPSPCFVYTGTMRSGRDQELAEQPPSLTDGVPECTTPRGVREPRLTLYIAYEMASPRIKRRCPEPAPYRLCLSEADDSMLFTCRGLDQEVRSARPPPSTTRSCCCCRGDG